jgi:hypothetical protein
MAGNQRSAEKLAYQILHRVHKQLLQEDPEYVQRLTTHRATDSANG